MSTPAFEVITTRVAWAAAEALEAYEVAEIGVDGTFVKGTGAKPFVGIVQYGAESAGDMATVVTGIFPVMASAAVTKGDRVMCDSANPGKVKPALAANDSFGIAVMDIAVGTTGSVITTATAGTV